MAAALGSGSRFAAVEANAAAHGASNPAAVAAAAGMRKYGKAKMEKMAQAGRRKKRRRQPGSLARALGGGK